MANKLYAQYRDKPKITAWSDIPKDFVSNITDVAAKVRDSYDIDNNSGERLNVIGRIIDQDRSYESKLNFNPSSFGASDSMFGGLDSQFGATYGIANSEVSDQIYRMLIKSKIEKNSSDATIDSILNSVNIIVPTAGATLVDGENMTFSISFASPLDPVQRFVLDTFDIIPSPQGVKFLGYTEETAITTFGGLYDWGDACAQFGQFFGV